MPVLSQDGKECARKDGQTEQGLCDMVGNVSEWMQDTYQPPSTGAPNDTYQVARGGSFLEGQDVARRLRPDYRRFFKPDSRRVFVGFRLARPAVNP
jgi:formylglycine-generating enzyme required for sulfatase activity